MYVKIRQKYKKYVSQKENFFKNPQNSSNNNYVLWSKIKIGSLMMLFKNHEISLVILIFMYYIFKQNCIMMHFKNCSYNHMIKLLNKSVYE